MKNIILQIHALTHQKKIGKFGASIGDNIILYLYIFIEKIYSNDKLTPSYIYIYIYIYIKGEREKREREYQPSAIGHRNYQAKIEQTHTISLYICIYIYVCVCVCVFVCSPTEVILSSAFFACLPFSSITAK